MAAVSFVITTEIKLNEFFFSEKNNAHESLPVW